MLFSRRSATSACAIVLIVMAVTPYHRFSSSIGLVSGAMTWLVILGACLAAFGHGVALRKGREIRRPGFLGAFGIFLAAIAAVPEWADLAFYARGDSIPFVFAPIWLLRGVSCASCFAGSLLLSYVIWDTAGSPLIRGAARDGERGTRRSQSAIFTETIAVLSCLLFCCRVSWRVVPEPWGMPSVTAASIGIVLLIPLVYLVLAAVPLLCCPRAFGRGQGDVSARSVLVAVPIGLVPAVEVAYFANDATIIALLAMGSAITVAVFVCTLLRGKRDNNSDTPRTSDPFDAGVFSPALSPREEQFVRLLLKGKTPAEIARETDTKPSTVRTTLHRAYGKASVAGSRELVALFVDEGDARTAMTSALSGVRQLVEYNPDNRLPASLQTQVLRLCSQLNELQDQWDRSKGQLSLEESFHARHIALSYLPDALKTYLSIPKQFASTKLLTNGKTAEDTFRLTLEQLSGKVTQLTEDLAGQDAQAFLNHSQFLSEKFNQGKRSL